MLAWYQPREYKSFVELNEGVQGLIAIFFAIILNAFVISIFGNSLGKAIFGLRAIPTDSGRRASIFWVVGREIRVWLYGLAMGFPIFSLFTMGSNHREVKAGKAAHYDKDRAEVLEAPISDTRRAFGILFGLALTAALLAFNIWSDEVDRQIATAKPWTNPSTQLTVSIPGGWTYDASSSDLSKRLFAFSSGDGTAAAFIGVENAQNGFAAQQDISLYGEALAESLEQTVEFTGYWTPTFLGSRSVLYRPAKLRREGWPASFAIWAWRGNYWRIIVLDTAGSTAQTLANLSIVEALIASVPR